MMNYIDEDGKIANGCYYEQDIEKSYEVGDNNMIKKNRHTFWG